MGIIQHCCQLAQLQGQRGLPWPQVPLAQTNRTAGGHWSPPPTWGTAGGWSEVPWECGQSPESEHSTGGCHCLSLPFTAGEHQAVVSPSLGSLVSPACPLSPPSPGGHWRSVPAAAGPGQRGQMSSVSVGGELSVGITADGYSSVRLSAHNPRASWHGLGSLEPCLAWGSLHGGFPTQLAVLLWQMIPHVPCPGSCGQDERCWGGAAGACAVALLASHPCQPFLCLHLHRDATTAHSLCHLFPSQPASWDLAAYRCSPS